MSRFQKGDRVVLKPHGSWLSALQKLANSQRPGTVENVFTPLGSNQETIRVKFDHKGGLSRNFTYFLRAEDLLPAPTKES